MYKYKREMKRKETGNVVRLHVIYVNAGGGWRSLFTFYQSILK